MTTYTVACDGEIQVLSTGAPSCSTPWVLVESHQDFDPSTLDPVALAQAFGVGFVFVGVPLAVVFGARAVLKMIRS